ncbi:MAG: hypothetical protein P0S96_07565 [Simkaniaceae bacterium]|nr:hypothetical protein [Candidatus Sacchlamyda saccharinae]
MTGVCFGMGVSGTTDVLLSSVEAVFAAGMGVAWIGRCYQSSCAWGDHVFFGLTTAVFGALAYSSWNTQTCRSLRDRCCQVFRSDGSGPHG